MKYRKLPLYTYLERLAQEEGSGAMESARGRLALELFRAEGFQFIVQILRDLEVRSITALRRGLAGHERQLGRLNCIEEIRLSLAALLPDNQAEAPVDWMNEEEEAFVNVDANPSGEWIEEEPHAES